jgi:diaminopimelate decarboxylase
MKDLSLPFTREKVEELLAEYGSPLHVYDEAGIRSKAKQVNQAFDWAKGYRNYFAVKATPTPAILQILHEEEMGFDASSRSELLILKKMQIPGDRIFFTANNIDVADFELAIELGAIINIDDITQVREFVALKQAAEYHRVAIRYTPEGLSSGGNTIIGSPAEAKFGMSLDNLVETYKLLKDIGIKSYGLHMMVVSNELNTNSFGETARLMKQALEYAELHAGVSIDFVNLGGGFGLNYLPDQPEFDIIAASESIRSELGDLVNRIELFTENGRYITGPHGYLISRVTHVMSKYKNYLGLDASMHNLMRPGMYGAYHHITVMNDSKATALYDVVGSLCENNDKFAVDRQLPVAIRGDLVVVHDTGAHGHSMGFNYNGKLRSAESLLRTDGTSSLIRRAETFDDYTRTLIW